MLNIFSSGKEVKNKLEVIYPDLRFRDKELFKEIQGIVINYAKYKLKDIDGFEEKNEFLSKYFKSFSFRLSEINEINTDLILSNKEEFLTFFNPNLYDEVGLFKSTKEKEKVFEMYLEECILILKDVLSYYLNNMKYRECYRLEQKVNLVSAINNHYLLEIRKKKIDSYLNSSLEVQNNFLEIVQKLPDLNSKIKGSERRKWIKLKPKTLNLSPEKIKELTNTDLEIDYSEVSKIFETMYSMIH